VRSILNSSTAKYHPFVWLALGALLFLFSNGKWGILIAAWLAPIFLIRFMRIQKPFLGLFIGWLVVNLVALVSWHGLVPAPGVFYFIVVVAIFSFLFVPYIVDRLLTPRLDGYKSVLVLPLAAASIEYLYSILFPWGTWCTIPYSQSGSLPLLQLLSLTGMWGVTFLVYWFASTVNWVWEKHFDWKLTRQAVLIYAVVFMAILSYGLIRMNFFRPPSALVRTASLGRLPSKATQIYESYVNRIASANPSSATVSDEDIDNVLRASMKEIQDELFSVSAKEAQAGAKIIIWAENSAPVLKQDKSALVGEEQIINRGKQFASKENVYLGMSLQVVYNPKVLLDNRFVLVAPDGVIALDYFKAHPIFPAESSVTLNRSTQIPLTATQYGRLSVVICHDMDFHRLLQQAGRASSDIVFDPSADWKDIDPFHTQMAKFRAIEQGFSMVRPTYKGLSMATDYQGSVLSVMDYYQSNDGRMISYVPTQGVATLYSKIGDIFAWLCIASLFYLILEGLLSWKRSRHNLHTES
jgi:apolipoprotein N-acyltransferase